MTTEELPNQYIIDGLFAEVKSTSERVHAQNKAGLLTEERYATEISNLETRQAKLTEKYGIQPEQDCGA